MSDWRSFARKGASTPVKWRHLSSAAGDLPAPPGSNQQTCCVLLDADRDLRPEFMIGRRHKAPCIVWYRPMARGWAVYLVDADALPIEAGGADLYGNGRLDLVCKPYNWQTPRIDLWINEA